MQKAALPAGFRDYPPVVFRKRQWIFQILRKHFELFGFQPLETPAVESTATLTGKYGDEGDRLISRILNSGDFLKDIPRTDITDSRKLLPQIAEKALRYDLTVPFARFVVQHRQEITLPFRRYQMQPVWRGESPAKGRYREFWQCDADIIGSDSLLLEAELVSLYFNALTELGFGAAFTIRINHRKLLEGLITAIGAAAYFKKICITIDKIDKIGIDGVKKELTDHRDINEKPIPEKSIAQLIDLLTPAQENDSIDRLNQLAAVVAQTPAGKTGVEELRTLFEMIQIAVAEPKQVIFDPTLARGLDYYTGCIFEVTLNNYNIGSIGGGGRYGDLAGIFGWPGLSGVGISFGADRIYDAMEGLGLFPAAIRAAATRVLIANFEAQALTHCFKLLQQLRSQHIAAEIYPETTKLKKQFEYAEKKQIPYLLIIGSNELAAGTANLKNVRTGVQETLLLSELISKLTDFTDGNEL